MAKKKKSNRKKQSKKLSPVEKILIATAILNLLSAIINFISHLM